MNGKHLRRNCHSSFISSLTDFFVAKAKQVGNSTGRDNAPCTTAARLASRVGHPNWELQADERIKIDDSYSVIPDAALSYAHIVGKHVGVDGLFGLCAKAKRLRRAFTRAR